MWVPLADSNCYSYGNSNCNGNPDGHSNDDSSSVAHAFSDGATTDNTYTTALSNAAAAPIDYSGFWNINGNSRSNSRVPASIRSKVERVFLAPFVEAAVSAANELAGGTPAIRTDSSRGETD
jgi:hypothetical protein